MTSPFSKEFRIPGERGYPMPFTAAVFDSQLWFIGADAGLAMYQLTLRLVDPSGNPLDIENEVTEAANWSSSLLTIPGVKGLSTRSRCGAVPVGDALHLVWNNYMGALFASRYTVGGGGQPGWQRAVTLVPQGDPHHGELIAAENAEVSVTAVGDDTLIVACPHVHTWWAAGQATIYIGTFKVDDIDQQSGTWQARSDIWGGPKPKPPFGPDYPFPKIGDSITIDWFTAAPQSGQPPAGARSSYLWVQPAANDSPLVIPLDTTGTDTTGTLDYANRLFGQLDGWPSAAVRDPAGRIRTYRSNKSGRTVDVRTFPTYSAPDPNNQLSPLPYNVSQIQTAGLWDVAPTVTFVTQFKKTPDTATYTYKDPQTNKTYTYTGVEYPVYEFVIYGEEHAWCQVDRFGTAQVFPDIPLGQAKPAKSEMIIPSGIIDGPIPIPAVNLADAEQLPDAALGETSGGDTPEFGTVTYSATQKAAIEHSVSNSWSVGFKSEGESDKGYGPAWDISLSAGMAYVKTDGTTTSFSDAKGETAKLDPKATPANLVPGGTVWGAAAKFLWTAYRFLDANGNPIADGFNASAGSQAPLFTTFSCSFEPAVSRSYVPYAVTPGDLDSYTPEGWNKRMAELGEGDNYFGNVIEANAYQFTKLANYLTASWSSTGTSEQSFEAATTDFTETSWTLDGELYVGVSGGEGATIFGVGEEESFKFLVGGTYSHEASAAKEAETAWGIEVGEGWGPPSPSSDPKAVSAYTFRVYFLPVPPQKPDGISPNHWVKELKNHAKDAPSYSGFPPLNPDTIDGNACAWKIVFVVTDYQLVDGTTYDYKAGRRGHPVKATPQPSREPRRRRTPPF